MKMYQHRFASFKEVSEFICKLETEQKTKFGKQTSFRDIDQSDDWRNCNKSIQWESRKSCSSYTIPFDGIPFINLGSNYLECRYGPKRCSCKRCVKEKNGAQVDDHTYCNSKHTMIQTSCKLDCPAKVVIRKIVIFNDFFISKDSEWLRRITANKIKEALADSTFNFNVELFYVVSCPSMEKHQNHYIGPMAEASLDVDDKVMSEMKRLFDEGVRKVGEMQRRIRNFVFSKNFVSDDKPLECDSRFWPSRKAIQNCLYRYQIKARLADNDLQNLLENVPQWQKDGDNYFVDITGSTNSAIFVYQSRWQKDMLTKYGAEVCLIDSTYQTTRYNLPLLVVAIATGVGYFPVAFALLPAEKKETIFSALEVLAGWSPEWKPKYFMSDFHEGQFQAIEAVFPETRILICDFHRIQAWRCRFSRKKNKKNILSMLESVACSNTEDNCAVSLQAMYMSDEFMNVSKLHKWFDRKWLPKYKCWVKCYRIDILHTTITTNNGLERLHQLLKYTYLTDLSNGSSTELVSTIVKYVVPDCQRSLRSTDQIDRNYESLTAATFYKELNAQHFADQQILLMMCHLEDDDEISLHAGITVVSGFNVLTLFKQTIKAELSALFECTGGDDDFRMKHWRHFDFIDERGNKRHIQALRDPTRDRVRTRYITEQGMTELAMLTLFEFFKIKIVYDHDSIYVPLDATFLTLRSCHNRKLMQLLENGGDVQRYNRGMRYAMEVAIPTSFIFFTSAVYAMDFVEADKLLYPFTSRNH